MREPAWSGLGQAIWQGDALATLRELPDEHFQAVCTSPPYFGLRKYLPSGHPDAALELGAEATPQEYVARLVAVFREVKRVLRRDGVCWVNVADSYNAYNGGRGASTSFQAATEHALPDLPSGHGLTAKGIPPKSICLVPERLALALADDGWTIRSRIAWVKMAPMPESVRDRFTSAWEHVWMLTKQANYYFDQEAVREPIADPASLAKHRDVGRGRQGYAAASGMGDHPQRDSNSGLGGNPAGRNRRNVLILPPEPLVDVAHFAAYPTALVRILLACSTSQVGCCPRCRAPWRRCVERTNAPRDPGRPQARRALALAQERGLTPAHLSAIRASGATDAGKARVTQDGTGKNAEDVRRLAAEAKNALGGYYREFLAGGKRDAGFEPACSCDAGTPVPCRVLDPFSGSGTTLLVCRELGLEGAGIELNESYVAMSARRIDSWMKVEDAADRRGQASLFEVPA